MTNTIIKTVSLNNVTKQDLLNAITVKMTGKMENMQSLSTSIIGGYSKKYSVEVEENKNCTHRINCTELVCSKCYANAMRKRYTTLSQKLIDNTALLTLEVLPLEVLPYINSSLFRFESFADLRTWQQVANYFNICNKNKETHFALWTKNPWIIAEAIEKGYTKPENIRIVYSSCQLNRCEDNIFNLYPFIDTVFTVYTAEYATEHDVKINCGDKKCIECRACYTSDKRFVNEMLKQEMSKYKKLLAAKNSK